MKRLIFATQNEGKLKEIKKILADLKLKILGAKEVGIEKMPKERGRTFEENALKKAIYVAKKTKEWTFADDSGLCIEALGGAPGVFSSRWAGENASDEDLIRYTLEKLKKVPKEKRKAYFKTAIALVSPKKEYWLFKGKIEGYITKKPKGKIRKNLPYDSIFVPKGEKITFAQMSLSRKNKISHRAKAILALKKFIERTNFLEDIEKGKLFYVICHNLRSALNVGAIFRTADGAGVDKLILGGYTPSPPHPKIEKTALSSEDSVPFEKKTSTWREIEKLKRKGFEIVALETKKEATIFYKFKPKFPMALILGNEISGISPSILKRADKIIKIPMRGIKKSLNVAVAFGIVAYHISGFRYQK